MEAGSSDRPVRDDAVVARDRCNARAIWSAVQDGTAFFERLSTAPKKRAVRTAHLSGDAALKRLATFEYPGSGARLEPAGKVAPEQAAELGDILAEVVGQFATELDRKRCARRRPHVDLLQLAPERPDQSSQASMPRLREQARQSRDRIRRVHHQRLQPCMTVSAAFVLAPELGSAVIGQAGKRQQSAVHAERIGSEVVNRIGKQRSRPVTSIRRRR